MSHCIILLILIRSRNESTKSSYLFEDLLFFVNTEIDHTFVYGIRFESI